MYALDSKILADIGRLIKRLNNCGFITVASRYDSGNFGNYYLDIIGNGIQFRLVRDRGQYMVHKIEKDNLVRFGLWKAFENKDEFEKAVVKWIMVLADGSAVIPPENAIGEKDENGKLGEGKPDGGKPDERGE